MENSKIEWTDHTFNPWIGCTKVSPGCDHCYAETLATARLGVEWGPGAQRRRTAPANWAKPRAWDRKAKAAGTRAKVFCSSLADVFDNAVSSDWRADLAELIAATPNLDWLLLTKRIGNAAGMLAAMFPDGTPPNVWLGATIVNQAEANRDIPKLLATPVAIRFLSMEPLLGPVDLTWIEFANERGGTECWDALDLHEVEGEPMPEGGNREVLDWVIVGGESGPGARPMHPDWARRLRDQCAAAGVAFLFKQWGEWVPLSDYSGGFWPVDSVGCIRLNEDGARDQSGWPMQKVGKKHAGRLLDGVEQNGRPS